MGPEEDPMPLVNFGSILNFAEEIESQDAQYYTHAADNPAGATHQELFRRLAGTIILMSALMLVILGAK